MTVAAVGNRLRLAATLVLAVAFFLPQYTCSVAPRLGESGNADSDDGRGLRRSYYTWEHIDGRDPFTWLIPAAFVWPIPFLLYRRRTRRPPHRALPWTELVLVAGSAYMIVWLSGIGERAIGAYSGLAANALYAVGSLHDLLRARLRGSDTARTR